MFLKKSYFDSAEKLEKEVKAFFHEAGHAYTFKKGLSYGGPNSEDKRKEWAEISGIDSYKGECSIPTNFILESGFLTAYGSTMADEDLAEWVGITYHLYYINETFGDLLTEGSSIYDIKYQQKIDFLLAKGFISQEIYDAVTQDNENSVYAQFNAA